MITVDMNLANMELYTFRELIGLLP